MNQLQTEIEITDVPLPNTHRELELLLEALAALNQTLDHYLETPPPSMEPSR
jgi:hypothetical protein